ncbi:YrpD family protein, partial [Paenibacillus cisolokensis]|uniref:YrpD family protein n=1 Tax=Paenibacillus cisolokensis TaxID=1658519 RepID=UPI003D268F8C
VLSKFRVNLTGNDHVQQSKIDFVLNRINVAKNEIKASKNIATESSALNYTYMDIADEIQYSFEEVPGQDPTLTISVLEASKADANQIQNSTDATLNSIPDGIGGRATISQALSGSMLTTDILLGTDAQLSGTADQAGKTYAGFLAASGQAVDAGLSYTTSTTGIGRWRPNMLVYSGGTNYHGTFKDGYSGATTRNGYKPGTTISYVLWKNYTDSTISKAIRLKVMGYAHCADSYCNNPTQTYLTSIIEAGGTNVGTLSYWKLVATVAGTEGSTYGKNYAKFSNIQVDGTAYTPVKSAEDYATVTISGNTVTINVSR